MDLNKLKAWLISQIEATDDPELLEKLKQLLKAHGAYEFKEQEALLVSEPEVMEREVNLADPDLAWEDYPEEVKSAILRGLEQSKNPKDLISLAELKKRMESWDEE